MSLLPGYDWQRRVCYSIDLRIKFNFVYTLLDLAVLVSVSGRKTYSWRWIPLRKFGLPDSLRVYSRICISGI
jgi:hypothetical protein